MRVIIVGFGNQGQKRKRVAGSDCVGVVDPFNEMADYKSIEQVPLNSFDAAMICTPDKENERLAHYFLKNNKHILVEKPFVASRAALTEFKILAENKKLAVYTAYNHRFEPNIRQLKEVLASQVLGRNYLARFFYGNGTARNVRDSRWKDTGSGVIGDLGCHLLDISHFLFNGFASNFRSAGLRRFENSAYDHGVFITENSSANEVELQMETSLLSWKNTFTIDIYAELGSAHLSGLIKWGPSQLIIRKRTLPSGVPTETFFEASGPDSTWESEYVFFQQLCQTGGNQIDKDLWIQDVLSSLS